MEWNSLIIKLGEKISTDLDHFKFLELLHYEIIKFYPSVIKLIGWILPRHQILDE